MPNKACLEKLSRAVAEEKAALENCRHDNYEIFGKMMAYQDGRGPEPSIEDFLHWRDSVKRLIFEKKIDSGLMDL